MGNEHSSRGGREGTGRNATGTAKERQGSFEDPPYPTATQPIGESPRRLLKTQSLSVAATTNDPHLQRHSPKSSSMRHASTASHMGGSGRRIVTVNDGSSPADECSDPANDPALVALQKLPIFYPVIRDTVRNPVMKEITGAICRLDVPAATALVTHYQTLLRDNAETVSKEQLRLSQRLQDMDYAIGTLHQVLQDRSRKLSKQTEQLSTISQIRALLNSTRMCLQNSSESLDRLNACLPPEHRLKPPELGLNLNEHSEGN